MNNIKEYSQNFYKDRKFLHFNNAGLSLLSAPAKNKIHEWTDRFYKEGFNTDHDYMRDVAFSRQSLATLIGCQANEVAFFQSTAGAISQLAFNFPLSQNDEVITWDQEYSSNLYPWQEACKRANAQLVIVKSDNFLTTPVEKLIQSITNKTKLISVSWVQFMTGARTDLQALGKIAQEKNIFLFVDVMQGLGLHPFEMKNWGISAVAGGSHKWLNSPVGVGYLALDQKYISSIRPHSIGSGTFGTCDDPSDLQCEPKKDASKYEPGSKQVLEITALGASVELILQTSVAAIEKQVVKLSTQLAQGLKDKGFDVIHHQSSIVNFVPRADSVDKLRQIFCNFALRGPGIRLSPHAFNTEEEIDRIVDAL